MAVLSARPGRRGGRAVSRRWTIALGAVVVLLAVNVALRPGFLVITLRDGSLHGPLVQAARDGSELLLVSLGMLVVIATRGIDFSVGAILAVSGAIAIVVIGTAGEPGSAGAVVAGIGLALAAALGLGVWNGVLVAGARIPPIVATLVLMLAGRGLAALVTQGRVETVTSPAFAWIAGGSVLGLPADALLAIAIAAVVAAVLRGTALGTMISAIGANPDASRMSGVRVRAVVGGAYALSGLLAGVAGLIDSSNIMAAEASNAGLGIEVEAILAVVVGGTSLRGGRFSIVGTVLGVATVQLLASTVTYFGTSPSTTPVFEAVLIIVICVLQSPRAQRLADRVAAAGRAFGGRRRTPLASEDGRDGR